MSCETKEEKRQEGGGVVLTFPRQLTVVRLLAGNDLLHQLVVAAVAHCLDDVSHLEIGSKMAEMPFLPKQKREKPGIKHSSFVAISRK